MKQVSRWMVVIAAVLFAPGLARADSPYVPGELIVKMRGSCTAPLADARLSGHGVSVVRAVEDLSIFLVRFPVERAVAEVAQVLSALPEVEFAHPNYLGQGGFVPNDTRFTAQWHHDNLASPGADIQSIPAWDLTRGDAAVVLAVLDTGIERNHPEFLGRTLQGWDFVNNDNDPEADHSHGAACTGLAAANADNGFAVAGVDHFATILPVKVLDQNNNGTTMALIEGLTYSGPLARVISLSLINYPDAAGLHAALQAARDAGAILIACGGNGGIGNADVTMPGKSPLTISVGATGSTDARASFSGTGAALDVVAPGQSVRTVRFGSMVDGDSSFSGCSAATPVVAGIASLAVALDPTLTHDRFLQALIDGAEDQVGDPAEDTPGRDDYHGYGRVNAWRTLCIVAGNASGSVGNRLTARRVGDDVELSWPLGFVVPDRYNVHRGEAKAEIDKAAYLAPAINVAEVTVGNFTDTVADPPSGLYLYEVFARNCLGGSAIP